MDKQDEEDEQEQTEVDEVVEETIEDSERAEGNLEVHAANINQSEEKKESESSGQRFKEGQADEPASPVKSEVEKNTEKKKDEAASGEPAAAAKKDKPAMTKQQRIQAFFESRKIYPMLQGHNDLHIEDDDLSEFYEFQKHYMIMTEAGKPIYSRYGDEEILSPMFATVSAIIHKIQSYFVVVAEREQRN